MTNAKLVTPFAISAGVRNAPGVWTANQARRWITFAKSISVVTAAAEIFNERTMPAAGSAPSGYNAKSYARDFVVFRPFIRKVAPAMLLVGPGGVAEGGVFSMASTGMTLLKTPDLLAATPRPKFDVFSSFTRRRFHSMCSMGAQSQKTVAATLSEEWLSRPDPINAFYVGLGNRFKAGKGAWGHGNG